MKATFNFVVFLIILLLLASCQEQVPTSSDASQSKLQEGGQVAFSDYIDLQPEEQIYCAGYQHQSGMLSFIALKLERQYLAPKNISKPIKKLNDQSCNLNNLTLDGISDFDIGREQIQLQNVVAVQLGNIQNSHNWKIILVHPEESELEEKIRDLKETLAQECIGISSQKGIFGYFRIGTDCNYTLNSQDRSETVFEGVNEDDGKRFFVICNEPSNNYPSGHCTLDFSYRSHKAWVIFSAKNIHDWQKQIIDIDQFLDARLVAQMNSKECFGTFCKLLLGGE